MAALARREASAGLTAVIADPIRGVALAGPGRRDRLAPRPWEPA